MENLYNHLDFPNCLLLGMRIATGSPHHATHCADFFIEPLHVTGLTEALGKRGPSCCGDEYPCLISDQAFRLLRGARFGLNSATSCFLCG